MAFISGDHKILYGSQNGRGIWFGPVRPPTCTPKHADPMESDPTLRSEHVRSCRGLWGQVYPNGTKDHPDYSCVEGCLFDIMKVPAQPCC